MSNSDKRGLLKNVDDVVTKSAEAISSEVSNDNIFRSFHLVDLNGDEDLDVVFNGYAGASDELVVIFLNENGRYKKSLDSYGHVVNLKKHKKGSEIEIVSLSEDAISSDTTSYRILDFQIVEMQ